MVPTQSTAAAGSGSTQSAQAIGNVPLSSNSTTDQGIEELLPLVMQLTNPEQVSRFTFVLLC